MTDDDTPVGLPAHDERLYCTECNGVGMCEDVALVGPEVTTRQWRCGACSGSGLTASGLVEFANRFGAIHTHLARRYRDANDGGRPFDHADLCHLLRLAAGAEPEAPEGVR